MPSKSPLDAPYTAAECKQQLRRTVIASSADTSSSPSSVRMLSAMPGKHNSRSGLGFSETPCMESFKLFKPCSTNVATPRRLPVVLRLLDIWNALWINARDIQWCLWADTEYEVGSWRCNNEIVGKLCYKYSNYWEIQELSMTNRSGTWTSRRGQMWFQFSTSQEVIVNRGLVISCSIRECNI